MLQLVRSFFVEKRHFPQLLEADAYFAEDSALGDQGALQLGEALRDNTTVISLTIKDRSLTKTGVLSLLRDLKQNSSLRSLSMVAPCGVDFSDVGHLLQFKDLQSLKLEHFIGNFDEFALIRMPSLVELDFSFSGSQWGSKFCSSLCKNTTLERLNLSKSYPSIQELQIMCQALQRSDSVLVEVNLSASKLDFRHFGHICTALATNTRLRVLNLSNNNFAMARDFAENLAKNNTLQRLELSNCQLFQSCPILSLAIKLGFSVRELVLSHNSLTITEIWHLHACWTWNKKLKHLDFSSNLMSVYRSQNRQWEIKSLNFADNKISESGQLAFLRSIDFYKVKYLDISSNLLINSAAEYLLEQFDPSTPDYQNPLDPRRLPLKSLKFANNHINDETAKKLATAIEKNNSLTDLDIRFPDPRIQRRVDAALYRNKLRKPRVLMLLLLARTFDPHSLFGYFPLDLIKTVACYARLGTALPPRKNALPVFD